MVEGEVAYFGLLDGFRERCFSILTPPHCGTNYTIVLCERLAIDGPSVAVLILAACLRMARAGNAVSVRE